MNFFQPASRTVRPAAPNEREALDTLKQLDRVTAVAFGRAERTALDASPLEAFSLERGRTFYEAHVCRPPVTGRAKPASGKRYSAVFDKFTPFAESRGVGSWNHVTRTILDSYVASLDAEGHAHATEYLELIRSLSCVAYSKNSSPLLRSIRPSSAT